MVGSAAGSEDREKFWRSDLRSKSEIESGGLRSQDVGAAASQDYQTSPGRPNRAPTATGS